MHVLRASHPADPALDMALTGVLLGQVAAAERPALARVFRPGPTMAFGRLDALRPGFDRAREAARAHGFAPVVRLGGGHAAAYDRGSVVVELITPEPRIAEGIERRFVAGTALVVETLRAVGVDAEVGELPGEYCAGRFSVHAEHVKLAGVAQRSVRGASLTAAVVLAEGGERLRRALVDVYAALGIAWDPSTAGAADDVRAGTTAEQVERAVLAALAPAGEVELDAPTLASAVG